MLQKVKGVFARGGLIVEVEPEDGDQHQQRAEHRKEHKLDGGIDATRAAPDPDEEIHRDQHHFPEDVEEEQVEGAEDADHAGREEEHRNEIPLHVDGDAVPGGDHAQNGKDGGQDDQQQ